MRTQLAAIATIVIAVGLVACEPIGEPTASGVSGGGGALVMGGSAASSGNSSSNAGTSASRVPYIPNHVQPMLQDPDSQKEEWTEEVWAESEAHAMGKCQAIAEISTNSGSVTVVVGQPQVLLKPKLDREGKVTRSGRYICRLSSEKSE